MALAHLLGRVLVDCVAVACLKLELAIDLYTHFLAFGHCLDLFVHGHLYSPSSALLAARMPRR